MNTHTHTDTHLLTIAYALLFKAQFSLQVLDDGVFGSLDVGVRRGPGRPGDRGLPGERFAERSKKTETFVNIKVVALCSVTHTRYLNMQLPSPLMLLSGSLTSTLIWTCPAIAFQRVSSYLSQPQQECQGERGSAGVSEGPMKNDWQSVEGGMPLMEEKKNKHNFCLWDSHQRRIISTTRDLYLLTQYAEARI